VSGRRILAIEDETMICLMIEEVLRDTGCEVVGPTDKLEAARPTRRNLPSRRTASCARNVLSPGRRFCRVAIARKSSL